MPILIGGRPGPYMHNYEKALQSLGVDCHSSLEEHGEAALLLPGGEDVDPALYGEPNIACYGVDPELDRAQLSLLRSFIRQGKPVLGICRGCQLLNVALGGKLVQDLPDPMVHGAPAAGLDNRHRVDAVKGSWLEALYGSAFWVNSHHHQACRELGEGLRAAAFAPDGTVEALEHESLPILAVQWHPERLSFPQPPPRAADGRALFRYFLNMAESQ